MPTCVLFQGTTTAENLETTPGRFLKIFCEILPSFVYYYYYVTKPREISFQRQQLIKNQFSRHNTLTKPLVVGGLAFFISSSFQPTASWCAVPVITIIERAWLPFDGKFRPGQITTLGNRI